MSVFRVFSLGILALVFAVTATHAVLGQEMPASVSSIDLSVSTDNPSPNQSLTITAKSYSIDINSANLTWTVDGKVVQKGVGQTTLALTAPPLGEKRSVSVTAVAENGQTLRQTTTITAGSTDLIVESDGYVPPFFAGKIEPTLQTVTKIIAIPHLANSAGVEYDPKSLLYTWRRDDRVMESASGYGKQYFDLEGDLVPREHLVTVNARTRDGSLGTTGAITILAKSPFVGFYVNDPLYGPFLNKLIGSSIRIGSEKEVRILGIPFGFSKPQIGTGGLSYNWSLNGNSRPELAQNQTIILRSPNVSGGSANVELDVRHSDKILQSGSSAFSVVFSAPKESSGQPIQF